MAVLAPMRPELKAVVRAGGLSRTDGDPVFSHRGTIGKWSVAAGIIGMGPATARDATAKVLATGTFDHVMVVGIAGGLDPALPRRRPDGAPSGCSSIPTGPPSSPIRSPLEWPGAA